MLLPHDYYDDYDEMRVIKGTNQIHQHLSRDLRLILARGKNKKNEYEVKEFEVAYYKYLNA